MATTKWAGMSIVCPRGQHVLEIQDEGHELTFGVERAKRLLNAMSRNGVEGFVEALLALVALEDPDWATDIVPLFKPTIATEEHTIGVGEDPEDDCGFAPDVAA